MIESGAIHGSMKDYSSHKGLPQLVAGVDEKYYISVIKSWLFGSKYNVNNIVQNAQNSWLIGDEEINSYLNGKIKKCIFS